MHPLVDPSRQDPDISPASPVTPLSQGAQSSLETVLATIKGPKILPPSPEIIAHWQERLADPRWIDVTLCFPHALENELWWEDEILANQVLANVSRFHANDDARNVISCFANNVRDFLDRFCKLASENHKKKLLKVISQEIYQTLQLIPVATQDERLRPIIDQINQIKTAVKQIEDSSTLRDEDYTIIKKIKTTIKQAEYLYTLTEKLDLLTENIYILIEKFDLLKEAISKFEWLKNLLINKVEVSSSISLSEQRELDNIELVKLLMLIENEEAGLNKIRQYDEHKRAKAKSLYHAHDPLIIYAMLQYFSCKNHTLQGLAVANTSVSDVNPGLTIQLRALTLQAERSRQTFDIFYVYPGRPDLLPYETTISPNNTNTHGVVMVSFSKKIEKNETNSAKSVLKVIDGQWEKGRMINTFFSDSSLLNRRSRGAAWAKLYLHYVPIALYLSILDDEYIPFLHIVFGPSCDINAPRQEYDRAAEKYVKEATTWLIKNSKNLKAYISEKRYEEILQLPREIVAMNMGAAITSLTPLARHEKGPIFLLDLIIYIYKKYYGNSDQAKKNVLKITREFYKSFPNLYEVTDKKNKYDLATLEWVFELWKRNYESRPWYNRLWQWLWNTAEYKEYRFVKNEIGKIVKKLKENKQPVAGNSLRIELPPNDLTSANTPASNVASPLNMASPLNLISPINNTSRLVKVKDNKQLVEEYSLKIESSPDILMSTHMPASTKQKENSTHKRSQTMQLPISPRLAGVRSTSLSDTKAPLYTIHSQSGSKWKPKRPSLSINIPFSRQNSRSATPPFQ